MALPWKHFATPPYAIPWNGIAPSKVEAICREAIAGRVLTKDSLERRGLMLLFHPCFSTFVMRFQKRLIITSFIAALLAQCGRRYQNHLTCCGHLQSHSEKWRGTEMWEDFLIQERVLCGKQCWLLLWSLCKERNESAFSSKSSLVEEVFQVCKFKKVS